MKAKEYKARRKRDRSLEIGRFAKQLNKTNSKTPLTATGKFCYELEVAYRPQLMLGTSSNHRQFWGKTRDIF
tara:strand:- start:321 stop:536 length:216 start_codon:yes stop_codon:yes gene_type:complete